LECGDNIYIEPLKEAWERNMVSTAEIDSAAYHILRARMRLGIFDPVEMNPYNSISKDVIGCTKHTKLALDAARKCLVLMKNDKRMLPLNDKKLKTIGVLGVNTENCEFGDYSGMPVIKPVSILEGIKARVSDSKVLYAPWVNLPQGYEVVSATAFRDGYLKEVYLINDKVVDIAGRNVESIYYQPANQAPNPQAPEYPYTAMWSGDLQVPQTGDYTFKFKANNHCRLTIDDKTIIADGKNNDDSCTIRLEKGQSYRLITTYQAADNQAYCQLFWHTPTTQHRKGIDDFGSAADVLRKSDVAVIVLGTNMSIEREGLDRETIDLPAMQQRFIEEAYKVNKNIVVVLVAGSPLAIRWIDNHIPAVLNTWYGGQACGTAVAEALFGDYNPGGRLPVTYYASENDLPDFHDYDITKGRTYQFFRGKALYPFGHGLSYTTFGYNKPRLIEDTDSIHVSFRLTNTGKREGDEVTQLYVRFDSDTTGTAPLKQLRAFRRISLLKGERRNVTLSVARRDLRFWDDSRKVFITPKGHYTLMVGSSSANIKFSLEYNNQETTIYE
jgi:beta-glucosidase